MNIVLSTSIRNARMQHIATALDAGATPGYFAVYTAPMPAAGGAITTQTLLGTLELFTPSGSVANGELTFNLISDELAAHASGDIAWVRAYDGDGQWVLDMDAGDSNSNAAIKFDNTSVQMGGKIKITSGTLSEGNA